MLFAGGVCAHKGVRITKGERFIITGFVDVCAPPEVGAKFGLDNGFTVAYAQKPDTLVAPHLLVNVAILCDAYGARGLQLAHAIAYAPSPITHVNMQPLQQQCRCWLSLPAPEEVLRLYRSGGRSPEDAYLLCNNLTADFMEMMLKLQDMDFAC